MISDGAAGNERQALALAGALDLDPRVLRLRLRHPWDWLAPHLTWRAGVALYDDQDAPVRPPWPDIAIGCGRRAALLTRCLGKWSQGNCFTIQILDPRTHPDHFNLLITPRHDRLSGSNVIETTGALNAIDDAWLEQGRDRFSQLGALPFPRIGVLIGASNAEIKLDDGYFAGLLARLAEQHAGQGGSFLVSTSRRTPPDRVSQLRSEFSRWPGLFWGGQEDGENPYAGILAWSDRLIVSPDSVNMVSEACATGKPVDLFASENASGKLGLFHQHLKAGGFLADTDSGDPGRILRETRDVARQVRNRLAGRR